MSNKRIKVSTDDATYNTLPGNQGDFKVTLSEVVDTVFGQSYESQSPNLGQWEVTANSIFKGIAGYNILIKQGGTPVTMTAEATTHGSGQIYQITNAAHRVTSLADALTILDNAADHTADVESYDYLSGTITFASAYTVTGPVTVTGKYVPLAVIAKAKSFTLTQTQTAIDQTGYDDAQADGGFRIFAGGLKTIQLQLGNIFKATNAWQAATVARALVYIECDLDATNPGANVFRGFFKIGTRDQSGNQGAVEDEAITLMLYVPDGAIIALPFAWYIASGSKMNPAIQASINAFVNQTLLYVEYLPSGTLGNTPLDGQKGQAIVVEATLANSIDGLNTFTFHYQGSGALTAV